MKMLKILVSCVLLSSASSWAANFTCVNGNGALYMSGVPCAGAHRVAPAIPQAPAVSPPPAVQPAPAVNRAVNAGMRPAPVVPKPKVKDAQYKSLPGDPVGMTCFSAVNGVEAQVHCSARHLKMYEERKRCMREHNCRYLKL